MNTTDRYDASGLTEAQFEPESDNKVLRNLRGIRSAHEMDRAEAVELERLTDEATWLYGTDRRFSAADICELHRRWLGTIYSWAGHFRQVSLSRGSFPFASAAQVPQLMEQYETDVLARYTPCNTLDGAALSLALAATHVELVLIHPFRDGNGRIARLLSSVMALQAGLPLLNYSEIAVSLKQQYIAAVQSGLDRDYLPMRQIFDAVIARTMGEAP